MTLAALFVSSLAMAQMPYNPDANGDNVVGAGDLLTFLTFYGTTLSQPDLTCDYEGTDLEVLIIGLTDATLQLDSVYIEYLIYDTLSYYQPGCPDLINEPVVLERSYTLPSATYSVNDVYNEISCISSGNHLGYDRRFRLNYSADNNFWALILYDDEVAVVTSYNYESIWFQDGENASQFLSLPFPETAFLDQDGIQTLWRPDVWAANCEYFRLIPFWSVAE